MLTVIVRSTRLFLGIANTRSSLDLDDFNVENAYFRSFDAIVRRQLDPVMHKVGPKDKAARRRSPTLRRLIMYVLPRPIP